MCYILIENTPKESNLEHRFENDKFDFVTNSYITNNFPLETREYLNKLVGQFIYCTCIYPSMEVKLIK